MALSRSARILLLLVIDIIFFLVEIIIGPSLGIHPVHLLNFRLLTSDIFSLVIALYAIKLTSRIITDKDTKYSYGWHRAEILAALTNGVFLLALCFSIFTEAIQRFFSVPNIKDPKLVVIVGSLGLASNIIGLFLFHGGGGPPADVEAQQEPQRPDDAFFGHPVATRAHVRQQAQELQQARSSSGSTRSLESVSLLEEGPDTDRQLQPAAAEPHDHVHHSSPPGTVVHSHAGHSHGSLNMRALLLHVLGDALGNIGVITSGLIIWLSHLSWKNYFDPIVSLIITCIILCSALPLVKSTCFILLQGVPPGISLKEVDEAIRRVDGVQDVHELHIWQLSESEFVASVHVLVSRKRDNMQVAADIRKVMKSRGIHSSTVQPENYPPKRDLSESTSDAPDGACILSTPPDQDVTNPVEHSHRK
ncbi:cation efflux protein [Phellopilus nigrolimitatus]|nr:cation efflux protein [Phellopilus nigrolimitatus]